MGDGQSKTDGFVLYNGSAKQLRESRSAHQSGSHDLQDDVMDRARLDLRGFNTHGDKDAVNSAHRLVRLVLPPFQGLLDVLVQSFVLSGCQIERLEPLLVRGLA